MDWSVGHKSPGARRVSIYEGGAAVAETVDNGDRAHMDRADRIVRAVNSHDALVAALVQARGCDVDTITAKQIDAALALANH